MRGNVRSRLAAYGRIPKDLLRDSSISSHAVRAYALLDEVAGYEEVTMSTLGEWLGANGEHGTERAARRAVAELKERGWIEVVPRYRNGRQIENGYILNAVPNDTAAVSWDEEQGRTPTSEGADTSVRPGRTPVSGARADTSVRPYYETERPRETTPPTPSLRAVPSDAEREFEEWWEAYDHKVGKGQARKAYAAARRKADAATLLAGVERAIQARQGKERRYWPHPSTWLNGERWADEAPSNSVGNPGGLYGHYLTGDQ